MQGMHSAGSSKNIIEQLKRSGARITQARRLMVDIFRKHHLPLTELEIRHELARRGNTVNKTTVYREIKCLRGNGIIREINFGDGRKRYELDSGHHHHLVCTNCKKVDEIHIDDDVSHIERRINRRKKFKITGHYLEFFGLCSGCSGD